MILGYASRSIEHHKDEDLQPRSIMITASICSPQMDFEGKQRGEPWSLIKGLKVTRCIP